jgi:threonine dehydrogenase-like Zn-dependent dehydrogenase
VIRETTTGIDEFAIRVRALYAEAVLHYTPVVNQIVQSDSQEHLKIEYVLDCLLDYCGNEQALDLFKQLCRHYGKIDPIAMDDYVKSYREMWDSDDKESL